MSIYFNFMDTKILQMPVRGIRNLKDNRLRGLGDLVAKVAEPIKEQLIEHGPQWVKTKLQNCNCNKRREALNKLIPFKSD